MELYKGLALLWAALFIQFLTAMQGWRLLANGA